MLKNYEYIFWIAICVLLTGIFSTTVDSVIIAFFFVTFLLPVVIATSLFFNRYLVPRFLMRGDWMHFFLYLVYMLIVSIYLELLVMVLAFVILADYQIANLGKIAGDISLLTIVLYFIVFLEGMVLTIRKLREQTRKLVEVEGKLEKNATALINLRVDRKLVPVEIENILLVESLGDYVKVHTTNQLLMTKEKISHLNKMLPDFFIRTHRSFLVNRKRITSYSREKVEVDEMQVPIGRKYSKEVAAALSDGMVS